MAKKLTTISTRKTLGWFCFTYMLFMGFSIILETIRLMPQADPRFVHLGGSIALLLSTGCAWWMMGFKFPRSSRKSKRQTV